jgi:nicotinamide mononucleotide (NMN) deamidase PncC
VFYLTGGAGGFLAEILGEPGASATVLEGQIPYAAQALSELLGSPPESACSVATARALAMAAFQRARTLGGDPAFGLACTASLATNRTKQGEHRAHAAIQTADDTFTASWQFSGDRQAEETALEEHLWRKLAQSLDLAGVSSSVKAIDLARTRAIKPWRELILGEKLAHATQDHDAKLLLPGAFNPLHSAHKIMLALAEERTGFAGAFELSVANVDKPLLDYSEIEARLSQFEKPVWLTRLPTFLEKARNFPGSHFVLGADTFSRIVEAKYYGGERGFKNALAELDELGAHFIVFGRQIEGSFKVLSDLTLPDWLSDWRRKRCVEIDEQSFNEAISSTQLREESS